MGRDREIERKMDDQQYNEKQIKAKEIEQCAQIIGRG